MRPQGGLPRNASAPVTPEMTGSSADSGRSPLELASEEMNRLPGGRRLRNRAAPGVKLNSMLRDRLARKTLAALAAAAAMCVALAESGSALVYQLLRAPTRLTTITAARSPILTHAGRHGQSGDARLDRSRSEVDRQWLAAIRSGTPSSGALRNYSTMSGIPPPRSPIFRTASSGAMPARSPPAAITSCCATAACRINR